MAQADCNEGVLYSRFSRFYDFLFKWVTLPRQRDAIRGVSIPAGSQIMDLGVGTGLSLSLYPRGVKITGIDVSEKMLQVARRRAELLRLPDVDLRCVGAEAVDVVFPQDFFDFVFAAFVISVVDDPVDVLQRVCRVGKDDCTFVLVNHFRSRNPVMAGIERVLDPLCERIGWKNGVELEDVVEKAGLRIVETRKYLPTDIWTIVYARKA